ncbi:hypothetical protein EB001_22015, partial [bacterium]|nr:hypothetical protein [bacterium]
MTYKGTIDIDKQIILARPMSAIDKALIKVAYKNPDLRVAALKIVADDTSNKLQEFAKDRKWKNPETSNLIGIDRVLQLAGEDKMWAKAIVKKVTEEYKKDEEKKGGGKADTKVQNKLVKKLQNDVEAEISKFKGSKDITNPKDRAEFEQYLDEKLGPAQEELYREKIKEATGMIDAEQKKALKAIKGSAFKEFWEDLSDDKDEGTFSFKNWGGATAGAVGLPAVLSTFASMGLFGATIAGLGVPIAATAIVGGVIGGLVTLKKRFDDTPTQQAKNKII